VLTFVSQAAVDARLAETLGTRRTVVAVHGTRAVRRESLVRNTAVAPVDVDPGDGTVSMEGRVLASEPVTEVPLGRRYLLA
jgi:urease subunit alpha